MALRKAAGGITLALVFAAADSHLAMVNRFLSGCTGSGVTALILQAEALLGD